MKYLFILVILLFSAVLPAQTCRDLPIFEYYETMRVHPPGVVTDFDGQYLTLAMTGEDEVRIQSFRLTEKSELPYDFRDKFKAERNKPNKTVYWVITCREDDLDTVLFVQDYKLGEEFVKQQKRKKKGK